MCVMNRAKHLLTSALPAGGHLARASPETAVGAGGGELPGEGRLPERLRARPHRSQKGSPALAVSVTAE